jgi:hypothetical protein
MDAEVLRAGVVLAEVETRPEEDQSGPPAVECSTAAHRCALRGGAPWLGSWRQTLGQLLQRLEAHRGGSRRWCLALGSRGTTSMVERGRARWRWCWRFEKTLLLTEDKAGDKDAVIGTHGTGKVEHDAVRRTWRRCCMDYAWRS